jgi:hypothetical protein
MKGVGGRKKVADAASNLPYLSSMSYDSHPDMFVPLDKKTMTAHPAVTAGVRARACCRRPARCLCWFVH